MTKKIVISGYYGFKNFGDEAILSVLTTKLKSWDTEITVLSSNPEWTNATHNVNAVYSFDLRGIINQIRSCDILISGGGSLLQDVTSLKSLIYYSFIIFLALFYKKKVIIFAQGIGPIKNKPARFFVGKLLKKCTYVSVRDENSLAQLEKMNVPAELLCDPIYSTEIPSREKTSAIGIQLRDFKTMSAGFINHLALQVAKTFPDRKINVFSLQDAVDLEICKQFKQTLTTLVPTIEVEIFSGLTNSELIEQIATPEYMIAMRFHAILVALKAKVKTLAINYDIKVEKLAQEAGIPLISLDDFSNFEDAFKLLQNENTEEIDNFVATKQFNWSKIEEHIC